MSNRTWPSARVKRRPWLHFWGNFSEGVTGFPARVKPWRPWRQIEPWATLDRASSALNRPQHRRGTVGGVSAQPLFLTAAAAYH